MVLVRKTIRILLEGEPESTILQERIIKKYKIYFPNINFEVIKEGSKFKLLSEETLFKNYIKLLDPNIVCIFLPDYHPTTSYNLDHTNINTLRRDLYNKIERIESAHNIPDYKNRLLIHTFKHGGDVFFLTNLDLLFEEFNIHDEDFIEEIRSICNIESLEDLPQNPEEKSYEKYILKRVFKKAGKSYSIKYLQNLIKKLRIEDIVHKLPHFKLFLRDLFKFAEPNEIPERLKELFDI